MGPYNGMRGCQLWLLWAIFVIDGKSVKVPISPHHGGKCDATNPHNHVSYEEMLLAMARFPGTKPAFFIGEDWWFFDLDKCLEAMGWAPRAIEALGMVPGAMNEVSNSGTGLHAVGRWKDIPPHSCKNAANGFELYSGQGGGRWMALGNTETATGDSGAWVDPTALIEMFFPPGEATDPSLWNDGPVPEWKGPTDDTVMIGKMTSSKSSGVFSGKASIADLWLCNEPVLAAAYPSHNQKDPFDRSTADAALAQHLAFWTGKDCVRMERLMRLSALVRPKWDNHKAYVGMTVSRAAGLQVDVLGGKKMTAPDPVIAAPTAMVDGAEPAGEQLTWSGGQIAGDMIGRELGDFVYIEKGNKAFSKSTGQELKPEEFKGKFGGLTFAMDLANQTNATTDAWKAFTHNNIIQFPRYADMQFRPDLEPGASIHENGMRYINSYIPYTPPLIDGDPSRFINHIIKMLPHGDDALIFICFIAAVVQNPGMKFQWCPVLIGTEGNGKSIIMDAVGRVIGNMYTAKPKASDIDNKFNLWARKGLLAIIEELDLRGDTGILDNIKPLITNDRMEIQGKGSDQKTERNFTKLTILTNRMGAIPVTEDSRRFCMLKCAQENLADIKRDFGGGEYFLEFYRWLCSDEGMGIVANYLLTYQIDPRYNPAGTCVRAPITTSTAEVIAESRPKQVVNIIEAMEEGHPGFMDGWVSNLAIKKLLGYNTTPRKLSIILARLGYIIHPALASTHGNRTNNTILAEGGKAIIYIRSDHLQVAISDCAGMVAAYEAAQKYTNIGAQQ